MLITIAARFGRISWKYSSLAYALVLKDVGVLIQTFYLMATEMGLGGCAIGSTNIELFAKMTGLDFCVEGPVGQFALGRPAPERRAGVSLLSLPVFGVQRDMVDGCLLPCSLSLADPTRPRLLRISLAT